MYGHLLDPADPDDVHAVQGAIAAKAAGAPQRGLGHTLALLAISLVLFWVLQEASTDQTSTFVAALVIVLAVHEGGHWLAMKAFGYTDLKVFFIPMLGAAASGRKTDATATQQAMVSLLGPLPGIVFALAAAPFAPFESALFRDIVLLALALNVFNLLPVLPLDGGRYLHVTLFSRWPATRTLMRVVNALALLGLGWAMEAWILLALGGWLLFGAWATLPYGKAALELRALLRDDDDRSTTLPDHLVPAAMRALNHRSFARLTTPAAPSMYANGIELLWSRLHRPVSPSLGVTLGLLAAYLGSFVLAAAAVLALALSGGL